MSNLMLRRRALEGLKKSRLPAEYQEVEWIKSTGTQYINTGLYINQNTKIIGEFNYTGESSGDTGYGFLFGSRDTVSENLRGVSVIQYVNPPSTQTKVFSLFGIENISTLRLVLPENQWKRVILSKNGFVVDNVVVCTFSDVYNFNCSRTLFILNSNDQYEYTTRIAKAKVRIFEVYNNNILICKMIPCYKIDNSAIGMYDIVRNRFYTNYGTGTFEKGADVN